MSQSESNATRRLRERVERALEADEGRKVLEPLLERLVASAPSGSDAAVLGHRYLAEFRLTDHPWRALLHLKQVLSVHPDDDVALAMMGLAHAMSGHHGAAVASYRRASLVAPENPWYRHNLGHLLDVALDDPARALPHLRAAYDALGDGEPEVVASLAHCLSRIDDARRVEATALVEAARREHPHHGNLKVLAKALGLEPKASARRRAGASSGGEAGATPKRARAELGGKGGARAKEAPEHDPVLAALRIRLRTDPATFDAASEIWRRYCAARPERRRVDENAVLYAAALHGVVARQRKRPVTYAAFARAYRVDAKALARRLQDIERVLDA